MTSPYLTVCELAALLKFTGPRAMKQTRNWIAYAGVPVKRRGRALLVDKDHVHTALSMPDGKYAPPVERRRAS